MELGAPGLVLGRAWRRLREQKRLGQRNKGKAIGNGVGNEPWVNRVGEKPIKDTRGKREQPELNSNSTNAIVCVFSNVTNVITVGEGWLGQVGWFRVGLHAVAGF